MFLLILVEKVKKSALGSWWWAHFKWGAKLSLQHEGGSCSICPLNRPLKRITCVFEWTCFLILVLIASLPRWGFLKFCLFFFSLDRGVVGKPTSFFVHTATYDLLYLDCKIQGPIKGTAEAETLKADIYCIEPNLHGFVYVPTRPGNYRVLMKWNGREVRGSPFTVKIYSKEDKSFLEETEHDKISLNSSSGW